MSVWNLPVLHDVLDDRTVPVEARRPAHVDRLATAAHPLGGDAGGRVGQLYHVQAGGAFIIAAGRTHLKFEYS